MRLKIRTESNLRKTYLLRVELVCAGLKRKHFSRDVRMEKSCARFAPYRFVVVFFDDTKFLEESNFLSIS